MSCSSNCYRLLRHSGGSSFALSQGKRWKTGSQLSRASATRIFMRYALVNVIFGIQLICHVRGSSFSFFLLFLRGRLSYSVTITTYSRPHFFITQHFFPTAIFRAIFNFPDLTTREGEKCFTASWRDAFFRGCSGEWKQNERKKSTKFLTKKCNTNNRTQTELTFYTYLRFAKWNRKKRKIAKEARHRASLYRSSREKNEKVYVQRTSGRERVCVLNELSLCVQGTEHQQDFLSGQHNWYVTSHARPTYCNVCKEALSGVTSHGLSCEGRCSFHWGKKSTKILRRDFIALEKKTCIRNFMENAGDIAMPTIEVETEVDIC